MAIPEEINGQPTIVLNQRPPAIEEALTEEKIDAEFKAKGQKTPWMTSAKYIVSVDIGKQNDFTAIVLLERHGQSYVLLNIERWRHKSYSHLITRLRQYSANNALKDGQKVYLVDETGVGSGVVDWLRESGLDIIGISIHGGREMTTAPGRINAPKSDLVFHLQNIIEKHRLNVAPNLEHWNEVEKELLTFSPKVNPNTLHVSYEAIRSRDHDDMTMALAQAAVYGEVIDRPYIAQDQSSTSAIGLGGELLSDAMDSGGFALSPAEQQAVLNGGLDMMSFGRSVPDTERARQLMKGTAV